MSQGFGLSGVLCAVAVALAGCAGAPSLSSSASGGSEPVVVTNPADFSAFGNATSGEGAHLHDYWGGKSRLVLLEETQGGGSGLWMGDPMPHNTFKPAPGSVVPQGARFVDVTLSWVAAPGDNFGKVELWVKSAADPRMIEVAEVQSGDTVRIESANERNDLPHQTVSAWAFGLVMHGAGPLDYVRFQGEASMRVEVERGLEIPLFPAHPDLWGGASEIALFEGGQRSVYMGDSDGGWSCFEGCPYPFTPDDGVIVPFDAAVVEVVLEQDANAATKLGLKAHGADSREFAVIAPAEDAGGRQVYRIPVERGMGDGPYARQSLWEFLPFIAFPQEHGAYAGAFSLSARALRSA